MDQDFHYYGTYAAACCGGWEPREAEHLARCANFVDFLSGDDYWCNWSIKNEGKEIHKITHPRMSMQPISQVQGFTVDHAVWVPFHFLPGNYGETERKGEQGEYISDADWFMLCRPGSSLAQHMMLDTLELLEDENALNEVLKGVPGAVDKDLFVRSLLGVRLHVFADTWAHQDFSGVNSYNANSLDGSGSSTFSGGGFLEVDPKSKKMRAVNVWRSGVGPDDTKAAPLAEKLSVGHGAVGHWPDFSFAQWTYTPRWLVNKGVPLTIYRDNPPHYFDAFDNLTYVLLAASGIRAKKMSLGEARSGFNLNGCNEKFRSLSREVISAYPERYQWTDKTNSLAPPARESCAKKWYKGLQDLGVAPLFVDVKMEPDKKNMVLKGQIGGDAWTRFGTMDVEHNSELHLFELAVDYHYRFVKEWLKDTTGNFALTGKWANYEGPMPAAPIHDRVKRLKCSPGNKWPIELTAKRPGPFEIYMGDKPEPRNVSLTVVREENPPQKLFLKQPHNGDLAAYCGYYALCHYMDKELPLNEYRDDSYTFWRDKGVPEIDILQTIKDAGTGAESILVNKYNFSETSDILQGTKKERFIAASTRYGGHWITYIKGKSHQWWEYDSWKEAPTKIGSDSDLVMLLHNDKVFKLYYKV